MEILAQVDPLLDRDGHLHTPGPDLLAVGKCDFCSRPESPLPWLMRVAPFRVEIGIHGQQQQSISYANDWAACPTCAGFLKRKDARGLAQHAAKHQFKAVKDNRAQLVNILTVVYNSLFSVTEWAGPNPATTN